MATKVIFRKWYKRHGGDIIALFPETPGSNDGGLCQSYMHLGQHGAANPNWVIQASYPATEEEYKDLLAELEKIGYDDLVIVKKQTRHSIDVRLENIKKLYEKWDKDVEENKA